MNKVTSEQNHKISNTEIQELRAIGILMVLFYHFYYRFSQIYINNFNTNKFGISYCGKLGVGLFIIISGCYIIPTNNKFNLIKFYFKKIIRLWPTYLFCNIIIFISTHIWYLPNRTVNLKELIINIFFINGFIGERYVDGAHWYLTYLIAFVFIIGLISLINHNKKALIYVLWLVLSIMFRYIHFDNNILHLIKSGLYILIGGRYVGYLLIGIFINRISKGNDEYYINLAVIVLSIICIYITSDIIECLGAVVSSIAVFLALKEKLKLKNFKPLIYIGSISYPLYLIHQNIGYQIIYYLMKHFDKFSYSYAFFAIIFVIILADLINKFIEKPVQRRINVWLAKLI
jgi:peptidoglycan/LPS O-acetylase OafA/YrhL